MDTREFFRKHLLKVFIAFIALQLVIFALVQTRNHRPVASPDSLSIFEGRLARVSPLMNDQDRDEHDKLEVASVSSPVHGTVIQKGNIIIYTPNKEFTGKDSMTYTVTDGKKVSKPAVIVIHVRKNQAPVTNKDRAVVYTGESTVIYALDNDVDNEKDSLIFQDITKPIHGEATLLDNKLIYRAGNSGAESDSFYYTVSDGKNISGKTVVKIDLKKKSDPCYPLLPVDIGDVSIPGKVQCAKNKLSVVAAGSDIWNNADGFYFVFRMVTGDCELIARVDSLEGPHEWTKSGLMIRENLSATSKNVFIGLTTKNGITSQARITNNAFSDNGERKADLKAPYWIKLSREGDLIRLAVSPDGKNWQQMEGGSLSMPKNIYAGIAVTSHDQSAVCTTVISNFSISGKTLQGN